MSEDVYIPNGELQGDEKPMGNGDATNGGYANYLGDSSKGDLKKGYSGGGSIAGDTKSDKGFA